MKSIVDQNQLLDEKIRLLQIKKSNDLEILKEHFILTKKSLSPLNIVKESFHDFKESKDIRNTLLESAIGIASGYFTKKLIVGNSKSIFKKISGAIVQYAVSNFITNKAEKINTNEKDIQNTIN